MMYNPLNTLKIKIEYYIIYTCKFIRIYLQQYYHLLPR